MASVFNWPTKYYYYPVGNTSAVCLTRDLSPEEPATMLLLGCGDARNVLYTVFSEPQNSLRHLDFTCSDYEPAVLARNTLLLTLILDNVPTNTLWNVYYHMYLDKVSLFSLTEQCKKLIELSSSISTWRSSSYGSSIRISTEYTLSEVRRHWRLYADMHNTFSRSTIKSMHEEFTSVFRESLVKFPFTMSTARSSGPTLFRASNATSDQARRYWKTGVTFSDRKEVQNATMLNPTFVYSLAGRGCCVHYATDPIASFHLAPLFGNANGNISMDATVKAAKEEFTQWCNAFRNSITNGHPHLIVRFFLGEATAVSRSLQAFTSTKSCNSRIPVAQWTTQHMQLDSVEYKTAPATFNIIETSNLIDYIGLLNVLIASTPLSAPTPSSVIYTESLLFRSTDGTKEFTERLHGNITTVGLLFGFCPVDYLAGYASRSNTHEIMMHKFSKAKTFQFHQVTTWKAPASGDTIAIAAQVFHGPLSFDPIQLGTLLYDIYHSLFFQEDALNFQQMNRDNMLRAIQMANVLYYSRETFVLLLKLVRERHRIASKDWDEIMDRFDSLHQADNTMQVDRNNSNDLWIHLHRHNLYTISWYRNTQFHKVGRFQKWNTVPVLVRIILTVPREKLVVLADKNAANPILHCDIRGKTTHNVFSSIHVAYGRAISVGSESDPRVRFEQDPDGRNGSMSLIVSFIAPTFLLTELEDQANLGVFLSVRSTTASSLLVPKLGLYMNVHGARLLDREQVFILPEQPLPDLALDENPSLSQYPGILGVTSQIGTSVTVAVQLDDECELVDTMTSRIMLKNERVKRLFGVERVTPDISQVSPCTMRISVAEYAQDVCFPFPVIGRDNRLRLARKTGYIEVVVPVYGPFKVDGMKLNPFLIPRSPDGILTHPWAFHRVNLALAPALNEKGKFVSEWLDGHLGSMMSTRERSLRKKHEGDLLMLVKDTINSIFVGSTAIQNSTLRRLWALRDEPTKNCDTLIFVDGVRYDLAAHTMVCDAYVLPLTHSFLIAHERTFAKLVTEGNVTDVLVYKGEMEMWKQLLPALVERCRTTWIHGENCEYKSQGKVPLTREMEQDPLCSCGRGKEIDGMRKEKLWKPFGPHVTRIAISPLFAVTYLESIVRDPAQRRCHVCRGRGKPKLQECSACKKVRYCSRECQRRDWVRHKKRCQA